MALILILNMKSWVGIQRVAVDCRLFTVCDLELTLSNLEFTCSIQPLYRMSKSAVSLICWKCDQSFANPRDRKNHMSSKEHYCLSVVCPFCPKRSTFKRSTPELRDHVKTHHGAEWAGLVDTAKQFFSEGNGFWLAVYPRDYRHLVAPSKYDSSAAEKARDFVREWLKRTGGSERSRALAEWESIWRSQRPPSVEPESAFVPKYDELSPPPEKRPRVDPEEYQPDAPAIDVGELTIQSIEPEGKDGIVALLFTDRNSPIWYRIVVSPKVYEDKKSVASIFRRATATKDAGIRPPSQMTDLGIASPSPTTREVLCSIADKMGISKRYIQRLQRGTSPISVPKKRDNETATKPPAKEDDQRKPATATCEGATNKDVDAKTGHSNPQDSQSEHDDLSDIEETYLNADVSETEGVDDTPQVAEDRTLAPPKEAGSASTNHKETTDPGTAAIPEEDAGGSTTTTETACIDTEEEVESGPSKVQLTEVEDPPIVSLPKTIDTGRGVTKEYVPTCKGDAERVSTSTKQRAMNLLTRGCLPLFPPAPREWDSKTISIPCGFTQISWPPQGWRTLSRDQRKLQLEFAAMIIEKQNNPGIGASQIHREALLSKYNVLTLPESDWPDKDGYRGVQFRNYEMLRQIATKTTKCDRRDEHFIQVLEAASTARDTSTDFIIDIVENAKLKLRLQS